MFPSRFDAAQKKVKNAISVFRKAINDISEANNELCKDTDERNITIAKLTKDVEKEELAKTRNTNTIDENNKLLSKFKDFLEGD